LKNVHLSANQEKLVPAIEALRAYIDETEGFEFRGTQDLQTQSNGLKKVGGEYKVWNRLADLALPMMHDHAYYEAYRAFFERATGAVAPRVSYVGPDDCENSRDPNDFKTRKLLADQAFQRREFRAASSIISGAWG